MLYTMQKKNKKKTKKKRITKKKIAQINMLI